MAASVTESLPAMAKHAQSQDGTVNRSSTVPRHDSMSSEPPLSISSLPPEELSADITSETSWSDAAVEVSQRPAFQPSTSLSTYLAELFEENVTAKICRTATKSLQEQASSASGEIRKIPIAFPEIVPQDGPNAGQYEFRDPDFWTCGFFPGTLYALLERSVKHPWTMRLADASPGLSVPSLRQHLRGLCKIWADPLHDMAGRTDTHDIGFIIMPALQRDWELNGNEKSLASIVKAAHSLATRYVPAAGAIRSWDCLLKKDITVTDMTTNLLAIVDSLCNLDLLFYASAHTGDSSLAEIATTHARTLLHTHLRPEAVSTLEKNGYRGQLYSTCHVANIDPVTGDLKWRWTAQGYANDSTWARGQAWAILGYAQTYQWTRDRAFLEAALGAAEYFLYRLDTAPSCVDTLVADEETNRCSRYGQRKKTKGRRVPLWDFDAPIQNAAEPLRDSSAGVIAANGMLVLSQALRGIQEHALAQRFFDAAVKIVRDTLDYSLADEKAQFARISSETGFEVHDSIGGRRFDGIIKHGTANNNENARRRYWNHGLVYGDYYLVEFGNRLLNMGLA
ncbi:unsaturated glucuronyl hydrolase [Colletotrichum scovillei]|uniref:Unsaturated glucuronyl hydrolase n=1 Tax=Colletotrichum scovillei TaxID=1209932 RepID=A0A9P7RBZ0_9PEZI|nr:unsaturated glucuronyl hydrolase [Colletotrichum scovillei]KAF4785892.1 unsaturated glucuronyl hydrolase [Colletotrichum scovillei]KAG7054767.1 unsaturated glucuronyl hydrolase [Colletotrichum scovillei]KAG7074236.1 unsaturated glucuronyl hydrolase [Colletotrichum scovillei]KAG7081204.1 unsaturated glucuronyl hydrolase [Colletotrichum scovillei]